MLEGVLLQDLRVVPWLDESSNVTWSVVGYVLLFLHALCQGEL